MSRAARRELALTAVAALGVLLIAGSSVAGVVTQHYEFDAPVIKPVGDYHRVTVPGAWSYGDPGQPVLPIAGARILLPPGEIITDVTIIPGEKVVAGDGFLVQPGQRQYPLSYEGPIELVEPAYSSRGAYPGTLHGEPNVGRFRGYTIANIPLHPVEYVAGTGTISYYTSMDVQITTTSSTEELRATETTIRHDDTTIARLERMIDNPTDRAAYSGVERVREVSRALDPALGYKYLIVTTGSWDDYLDDLVTFQTNRGLKAGVFLKSWINTNYTGVDEQDRIRNFVIDAYNMWDSDYVLLVGDTRDDNGIPHRGLYAVGYGITDDDIPADHYYVALDGNWNNDGDGRWGEDGEEDWYAELGVGRCCNSNAAQVQNFVTKTLLYQDAPIVDECDEALMVGELLWSPPDPLTYGGDYKDQVRNGGTYNGYTTIGFPMFGMNVPTLYDRDIAGEWSASQLISLMESGLNIVNHLGHCGVQYSMRLYNYDIASFDNDGTNHTLNFVYSQGCSNGSMDNWDPYGGYGGDCFAETFTCDDDGAVAVVMNSRYGWGDPGGTNGSSQFFDREFFDAMFGEGIWPIGDANADSKVDVLWAIDYGANKWCFWELNIFGDPAMHLWTGVPTALIATYPSGIIVGQPDMDVMVATGGRAPVAGARVTIYTDDYAVYDTAVTDASGLATVHPDAQAPGTLHVKVVAHDHLVYDGTTEIAPADGPYVTLSEYTVDDDRTAPSNGNEDGLVDAGETIELSVTLENVGTDPAIGVSATLSSTSEHVTLVEDTQEYGDIAAAGFGTSGGRYCFEVSSETADGDVLPFTLTISDSAGREVWESNFGIMVHAPVLAFADLVADDSGAGGNGNGCIEAGESVGLSVSLDNLGSATATSVSATISTGDMYVTIYEDAAGAAFINPDGTATLNPEFSIGLSPATPGFHEIVFDLAVTADWGYAMSTQFSIMTAGPEFADDVESGEGEWTHDNVTGGFADQWHIETYRSHSPTHSWKFGGSGSSDYANSADGALVVRPMCVGADGELTFWHRMNAEEESSTSAWDCGLLQITTDGGMTWEVLYPDAGYSHLKNYNAANPLPEGTPCWSGVFNWREESCDLSAYEGETIQVRFRFASDGYVTEEGWYVDDIGLTFTMTGTGVSEDPTMPASYALRQNAPNPFNPVTTIQYQLPAAGHVRIDVYNIAGRHVRTLVDEEQEPGYRNTVWDGTNQSGQKVASGVYMYRMQAGDHVSEKRMVLLK